METQPCTLLHPPQARELNDNNETVKVSKKNLKGTTKANTPCDGLTVNAFNRGILTELIGDP